MASSEKLDLYDPRLETFDIYVQRVKIHFAANGVADGKKKYVFLNSLGHKHFNLLANLMSPDLPESKSFNELVQILTKPTTSIIAERYTLVQRSDESITDFVADLQKLIVTCKYNATFQNTVLRDRFVSGLLLESTRKRLLTENNDITFERAVC